jgi:deoxyadenosine/deoxycytidine kinase
LSKQSTAPLEELIKQSDLRYIAIEGVIGAGKTTFAQKLGDLIGAQVVVEQFDVNPFLKDFYKDPERYAFQTQIFFLLNRYKQQQQLSQADLFHRFLVTDYIF